MFAAASTTPAITVETIIGATIHAFQARHSSNISPLTAQNIIPSTGYHAEIRPQSLYRKACIMLSAEFDPEGTKKVFGFDDPGLKAFADKAKLSMNTNEELKTINGKIRKLLTVSAPAQPKAAEAPAALTPNMNNKAATVKVIPVDQPAAFYGIMNFVSNHYLEMASPNDLGNVGNIGSIATAKDRFIKSYVPFVMYQCFPVEACPTEYLLRFSGEDRVQIHNTFNRTAIMMQDKPSNLPNKMALRMVAMSLITPFQLSLLKDSSIARYQTWDDLKAEEERRKVKRNFSLTELKMHHIISAVLNIHHEKTGNKISLNEIKSPKRDREISYLRQIMCHVGYTCLPHNKSSRRSDKAFK